MRNRAIRPAGSAGRALRPTRNTKPCAARPMRLLRAATGIRQRNRRRPATSKRCRAARFAAQSGCIGAISQNVPDGFSWHCVKVNKAVRRPESGTGNGTVWFSRV